MRRTANRAYCTLSGPLVRIYLDEREREALLILIEFGEQTRFSSEYLVNQFYAHSVSSLKSYVQRRPNRRLYNLTLEQACLLCLLNSLYTATTGDFSILPIHTEKLSKLL